MALEKTVKHLKGLLEEICHDLDKACNGNKAAAQRVRTNTIQFAKVAKDYRKESIAEGRKGGKKKAPAKKKAAPKKVAKKVVKKAAPKKKAAKKR
jgi:hypothetical protein